MLFHETFCSNLSLEGTVYPPHQTWFAVEVRLRSSFVFILHERKRQKSKLNAQVYDVPAHALVVFVSIVAICREASGCIVAKHEPDVHRVAAAIVKTRGFTAEKAVEEAMTSKHYKKHIRTFTPPNCSEKLEGVRLKYKALSQDAEARGERPLFQ